MSILDELAAAGLQIATATESLLRLANIGDFGTAGPPAAEHDVVDPTHLPSPKFVDGWWVEARRVDVHPHRIGPPIAACVVVDHTTDMHRDDFAALLKGWEERAGDGACANFVVGSDEREGTVQCVPITRNGNHVGGKTPPNGHGWFIDAARPGVNIHPNTIAIGIEYSCAGGQVRLLNGAWRFVEDGKIHGAPIPADTIEVDRDRPGRGWQVLTPYQVAVRKRLHADLNAVLRPMPPGLRAVSTGEQVPGWGVPKSYRFVGHVTLDPTNRSDPHPPGMRDLR